MVFWKNYALPPFVAIISARTIARRPSSTLNLLCSKGRAAFISSSAAALKFASVAAFLLVASWARQESWYRARVVVPASVAIAAVGLFWTVQRTMF